MANPQRPQAPGYLANLMARLFHDVSRKGLAPLGVRPAQFPVLVELWFGDQPVTRAGLCASQEMDAVEVDALVRSLADDGLIQPLEAESTLVLTARGQDVRDAAVAAARRANAAAATALSEDEMATFIALMNRVIDALQAARTP